MKFYITTTREAPAPPYICELFEIDIQAIPFLLSALWHKSQRYNWKSDEDARIGRQMIAKQGASLLMGCSSEIVAAVDRLYRLTDAIHNGTVYGVSGTGTVEDPYIYTPAMPLVPATAAGQEPSVKFSLEKSLRLIDNLVNGTTYADAPDSRNIRQQVEDLIAAVQAQGGLDDEMLDQLLAIAGLLA